MVNNKGYLTKNNQKEEQRLKRLLREQEEKRLEDCSVRGKICSYGICDECPLSMNALSQMNNNE